MRYDGIDALRGLAMVWMTAFHFCFDLNHFGYWPQDFRADPFWTLQRSAIVSLFLFCAGLGQAAAWAHDVGWLRFMRRWWQIAACAVLVTVGSALMFPRSFIYFGVLHGMAVMLLMARATAGWPLPSLLLLGGLALASPRLAAEVLQGHWAAWAETFNGRALNWLGWITRKPFTEDYVPLFPWMGVMWLGLVVGRCTLAPRRVWLARGALARTMRPLAWLGRHSLSYYMAHQPVMIGALMLWGWAAAC